MNFDEERELRIRSVTEAFVVFRVVWPTWPVDETTILTWVELTADVKPEELRPGALRVARNQTGGSWPTPGDLRKAIFDLREEKNRDAHADKWRLQAIDDAYRLKKDPIHGDWAKNRLRELGIDPDTWKPPYLK